GACLQHRNRVHVALFIEDLRHADLFAQNPCNCHFVLSSSCEPESSRTAGVLTDLLLCRFCLGARRARPPERQVHFSKALISTSTPAGRSSFISASTVCCVGSRMSISRLCVRISNSSRDFLSTCGERSTQYLFLIVGKGIGPATCAPVRLAVSTISPVEVSSTR